MNDLWSLISPDEAWAALFEQSPQAIVIINPDTGRIVGANASAEDLYGFSRGSMDSIDASELVDPSDQAALTRLVTKTEGMPFGSGGRHRRRDGSSFHAHVHVTQVSAKDGPLLLTTVVNRSEPDLIDAASGLPDPRLFIDRLEQSIVHAHRGGRGLGVCLLMIAHLTERLDGLPAKGSRRLLHDIGDRLRANLRETDTVARVGKSEFALIVEGVSEQGAILDVLRKVLEDFEYEFNVGDEAVLFRPSVGISVYPHDGHEADMLVANAARAARDVADGGVAGVRFFEDLQ